MHTSTNIDDKYPTGEGLVKKLNYLENYYADMLLSENLKQVYAEIQMNCEDFRENVFFKNIQILDCNSGKSYPKKETSKEKSDEEHINYLKNIEDYEDLIEFYHKKGMEV